MRLYYSLLILTMATFTACQNTASTERVDENITSVVTEQNCYSYIKNQDTASLMTMKSGHIVTGELRYQLYEKDKNEGSIKGEMRGDTLIADYTFGSEGKSSVRQVAFLLKNGKLAEGFGEVIEKDGKMIFKNLSALKFDNAIEFTKIDCTH